ncbi:TonB-dependent receptor [Parapedobacter indicus]|nr:TonB-dependent receptor [Parapedobacter indicus]
MKRPEKRWNAAQLNSILMRIALTNFLLVALFVSGFANRSSAQRITLGIANEKLLVIFNEINKQTGYNFLVDQQLLKAAKPTSLNVKNASLDDVLTQCLSGQGLAYTINDEDRMVIIKKTPRTHPVQPSNELTMQTAPAQQTIAGRVTDSLNNPLEGVTVAVSPGNRTTSTDSEGRFQLSAPPDATLTFSMIGFLSQEISLNGRNSLQIILRPSAESLEEVVVVGYGTQKRVTMAGAVSTVGQEVVESRPVTNTLAALQGSVQGLLVQRTGGQPGQEGFSLNVRGFSSTNGGNDLAGGGNQPLVLIDGVAGDLNLLNPQDIESISVLKDASASIYGSRGSNGVILVSTKHGKSGKPVLSYSGNVAFSRLAGIMETPDHYQFAIMDNEANIHNGSAPMYTDELLQKIIDRDPNPIPHPALSGYILNFPSTDWGALVFENGLQQVHNVSASGGAEHSRYYFSGSFSDQEGIIRYADDNNKRYNLRLNYDYNISKRIKLETKLSLENQTRSDIGGVGANWLITETIFGMPYFPVYTQSGEKYFAQGGWGNAVAIAREAETATYKTRNINTNFKLTGDIIDGLKLNLQAGVNYSLQDNRNIAKSHPLYTWDESAIAYYSIANPNEAWLWRQSAGNTYRNFTGYFQYTKEFAGSHEIDVMAGASYEDNDYDVFEATRDNFPTDEVWSLNLGGTGNMQNNGFGEHWAIGSAFSRLNYIYNGKYILEANLRYDGSSRFQRSTRWGFFPGVAVAWRLSEENFIKQIGFFDDLKLRLSYGETGNQEGIGLYDYLQLINIGDSGMYPFGVGRRDQSASLAGMVSLNRTWETLVSQNAGIDMSLFSSKLRLTFDYFVKRNKNMLIPVTYPSVLGAIPPYSNSGELKTWGFETSLAYQDVVGAFRYSARFILSDYKDRLVNYGGQDTYNLGLNPIREGYPINTYFAYVFDGLIRTQEELDAYKQLGGVPSDIGIGDSKYKDLNGDGRIDPYSSTPGQDGDVINAGNTTPRYIFGANLGGGYKNFDFSLFVQGVGRRTLFREGEYAIPWSDWWRQPPLFYYGQTWSADRPDAPYPKLSHGNIRYWNYEKSTLQRVNAAYIRIKNLQLGYTLPHSLLDNLSLSKVRLYVSGENLWEAHHVKGGWDPESSTTGFNYPFQRVYSFGIDVTF